MGDRLLAKNGRRRAVAKTNCARILGRGVAGAHYDRLGDFLRSFANDGCFLLDMRFLLERVVVNGSDCERAPKAAACEPCLRGEAFINPPGVGNNERFVRENSATARSRCLAHASGRASSPIERCHRSKSRFPPKCVRKRTRVDRIFARFRRPLEASWPPRFIVSPDDRGNAR